MTFYIPERIRACTMWLVLAATVVALLDIRVASAHVTINPAVVRPNTYQSFVVDVPTEKAVPTIGVRIEMPDGLRVARFQPKPGWERAVEKDPSGQIVAVSWTGGSIAPDEYEEFVFLARTPREPGPLVFRAYQTYEGGEVVAWAGAELDNFPAAVVQVSDEAPLDGASQAPPQIEEPVVSITADPQATTPAEATTTPATTSEPTTATPAPQTAVPSPSPAAEVASPTMISMPMPEELTVATGAAGAVTLPAGPATGAAAGSDLGLFVSLGALVMAFLAVAIATVGLLRTRGRQ